jgi:hypothetical protein
VTKRRVRTTNPKLNWRSCWERLQVAVDLWIVHGAKVVLVIHSVNTARVIVDVTGNVDIAIVWVIVDAIVIVVIVHAVVVKSHGLKIQRVMFGSVLFS